jgi:hypothetical protein
MPRGAELSVSVTRVGDDWQAAAISRAAMTAVREKMVRVVFLRPITAPMFTCRSDVSVRRGIQ